MKILIAGSWHSEVHEEGVSWAFKKLGHEVVAFPWCSYFQAGPGYVGFFSPLILRAQNKYLVGPRMASLNRDFITMVVRARPDVVMIYRGTHLFPGTLRELRRLVPRTMLIGYNNDDPFAPTQPRWIWRHFLAGIPEYDLVLAYRYHNLESFRRAGARRVELLRSWFVPERNHPVELSDEDKSRYECDVVFVGHYEPDQRRACLEAVARRGWRLRLFGPGYDWDPAIRRSPELSGQIPVRLVWGENYNRALCGAKIALCFLSKLNRDSYTRRCFEIPATRTMMLAEYTDDLAGLFREGEEAEFFRDPEEMIVKIEHYLGDDARRRAVAEGGYSCVYEDGHDVVSRMRQVLAWVSEIQEKVA